MEKTIVFEGTQWDRFYLDGALLPKACSALMRHYIGRDSVPLDEDVTFPPELQRAQHNAKCTSIRKIKYVVYSDGCFDVSLASES
jgi:hypothetical protein